MRLASATFFRKGNNSIGMTDGESDDDERGLDSELKRVMASVEGCPMRSELSA